MKEFKMSMLGWPEIYDTVTEETAPSWVRFGGRAGSTADMRWFWNDHVMLLEVGESVDTDFRKITRIK